MKSAQWKDVTVEDVFVQCTSGTDETINAHMYANRYQHQQRPPKLIPLFLAQGRTTVFLTSIHYCILIIVLSLIKKIIIVVAKSKFWLKFFRYKGVNGGQN